MTESEGQLQDYSVDQLGGFVVMVAGAIGSLLLVVWQSKCHCRINLCYIFQCERKVPTEDEMKTIKDQLKKKNQDKEKDKKQTDILKKEDEILKKEDEILIRTPRSPQPEPEPEILLPDNP
tara:strand:- start:800 stop:1162 length:363 start_codon:yes stop_codon:yes gene_type:complete